MTFLNDMMNEREYSSTIFETECNKPVVMTKKDYENYENSTKCLIFKKKKVK